MPKMCPAAEAGIDINESLQEIVDKRIYEKDYEEITSYFQKERVEYDVVCNFTPFDFAENFSN